MPTYIFDIPRIIFFNLWPGEAKITIDPKYEFLENRLIPTSPPPSSDREAIDRDSIYIWTIQIHFNQVLEVHTVQIASATAQLQALQYCIL